ncbi:nth-1, partial [Symbiodinium necroappetens]
MVKCASKASRTGAPSWKKDLSIIKRLRAKKDAPVDSIGCERLADVRASRRTYEWQCLVAAMLSSQTRDQATAAAMEVLRKHGNTAESIAATSEAKLAKLISAVGFFNVKAKTLRAAAKVCLSDYKGWIPQTMEGLLSLPGIGPKMAHLVMHSAFNRPQGICVDTHVHRIANRLRWVKSKTPEGTRKGLEALLPRREWAGINVLLVGLGQMQQQAASQLLERALRVRCSLEAVLLLQRMGVSLYAGQHVALDKLSARDQRLSKESPSTAPAAQVTYHTLISLFSKADMPRRALQVLESMRAGCCQPGLPGAGFGLIRGAPGGYNAAIRSLSGDEANFPGAWETATSLFRQLTSDGLQPDKGSFNALLSVYGNASRWTSVLQAVDTMCQVPWVSPDVITWSTAVDACGRSARWEAASYLMCSMRRLKLEANVVVWSALVKAYDQASCWDRALATAVRMMHPGRQRRALPRPNAVALTSAASACAKGQAWQQALALLWTSQRWHLRPSLTAFNTALSACAASKQWRQALAGLGSLGPAADLVTRNVVLASLEFSRRWEHALALVVSMVQEDFWPDIFSFNSLLSTFEKAAQWERAVMLLLRMLDFVVVPDDISCNVIVASCHFDEQEVLGCICRRGGSWRVELLAQGSCTRWPISLWSQDVARYEGIAPQNVQDGTVSKVCHVIVEQRDCEKRAAEVSFGWHAVSFREIRSSGALAVALAVALCCGIEQLLYVLAGRLPQAQSQRAAAVRRRAAIRDRGMALKTLGFTESFNSEPSEEELPDAFLVFSGSAEKLLLVKEAYDFLLNAPTVTVWDEGVPVNERRGSTTYTSPGRKWPRYPQERPKAWKGPRRELIIGGVVLGTVVAIGIATQVVSTKPRDDYLASIGDMEEGVEGLGGSEKKLPPLVKSGGYKLGEVYRQFADESTKVKRPVLLLGELVAGRPGSGTVERATSLATLLLSAMSAKKSNGKPRYESITAVILQDDVQAELLLVPAQKTYVDSSDLDPLTAKTLRENNSPGVFIFDLTREQWEEQKFDGQSAFLALAEESD